MQNICPFYNVSTHVHNIKKTTLSTDLITFGIIMSRAAYGWGLTVAILVVSVLLVFFLNLLKSWKYSFPVLMCIYLKYLTLLAKPSNVLFHFNLGIFVQFLLKKCSQFIVSEWSIVFSGLELCKYLKKDISEVSMYSTKKQLIFPLGESEAPF